jgi:outer membrane protein TolC
MIRRALPLLLLTAAACASDRGSDTPPLHPDPSAPDRRDAAALSDLSGPLRLEMLLPLLMERSAAIAGARARLEAAAQRHPQAISLPDPKVEATYFTKNGMDPSGTFTRWQLMVRQEIPFPVVLSLRGDEATKDAEAEALRYEAAVRDAVADLKDVHAERAYLAAAARVQSAVRDVYRRYADVARGGAATARTRLPESFRAEALVAQAEYELKLLDEMRGIEDTRLRAMLRLSPSVALGEPADAAEVPVVDANPDDLARRALAYNQELRAAGVMTESAALAARRARWELAPSFEIGGGKMFNDDYDPSTGDKHDSTVLTLGVTVPLWFPAHVANIREADANLRAARADEMDRRAKLAANVARAAFRLRNAQRLAELYGRELVPQAEQALVRSQSMIAEGKESLASSLELAAMWQQLRLAELRAAADHAQALAALERLLGTSAAPVPQEAPR